MPQVEQDARTRIGVLVCSAPSCGRRAVFTVPADSGGTVDDAARAAGWHIGRVRRAHRSVRVEYCPPCMDPDLGGQPSGLAS
jgi:hypothetical protein